MQGEGFAIQTRVRERERRAGGERTLRGWSEIAAYCDRTPSTVKRWAAERDLPVHRLAGADARKGIPVYAYPKELDAWLKSGKASGDDVPETSPDESAGAPQRRVPVAAAVAAGLIALLAVVGGFAVWQPASEPKPGVAQTVEIPGEARELYLRGTYLWNRRTPEGIRDAIAAFERAIEIHPDYADAHAGLAMAYNLARQYTGMSGFDAYPKAETHAARAVALDPSNAFAQSVLAFVEFHWHWNVEAGLARFEEALRLDPQSSNTLMWYASALILAGRSNDALPVISRAQQLAPDSSPVFNMKAQALFYSGHVDEAVELLEQMIAREPGYAWAYYAMSFIRTAQGDYQGYLDNYARLGDLIGVPRYRMAAEAGRAALAEGGVEAMAAAMIEVKTEHYERGEALAWDIARHHAMIGDAEGALRWLRVSLEKREERLIGILVDTAFWPIRDEPAFKRLVADIGLPV